MGSGAKYNPVHGHRCSGGPWRKKTIALNRDQLADDMVEFFYKRIITYTGHIMNQQHDIERKTLESFAISLFQMNPYRIETIERAEIAEAMTRAVQRSSNELASYLYDKYVCALQRILNGICSTSNLFHTNLTEDKCKIETTALILRVSRPIIIATIRWPHVFIDNRIEAATELTRIAPSIIFDLCENQLSALTTTTTPIIGQLLAKVLNIDRSGGGLGMAAGSVGIISTVATAFSPAIVPDRTRIAQARVYRRAHIPGNPTFGKKGVNATKLGSASSKGYDQLEMCVSPLVDIVKPNVVLPPNNLASPEMLLNLSPRIAVGPLSRKQYVNLFVLGLTQSGKSSVLKSLWNIPVDRDPSGGRIEFSLHQTTIDHLVIRACDFQGVNHLQIKYEDILQRLLNNGISRLDRIIICFKYEENIQPDPHIYLFILLNYLKLIEVKGENILLALTFCDHFKSQNDIQEYVERMKTNPLVGELFQYATKIIPIITKGNFNYRQMIIEQLSNENVQPISLEKANYKNDSQETFSTFITDALNEVLSEYHRITNDPNVSYIDEIWKKLQLSTEKQNTFKFAAQIECLKIKPAGEVF
ncbi:unnamed protein product [Didymodactylos carnosus]|uniref:Uncharacterized protein n=1 Tax=Didymodactylos carnosus TaxID=1234261 RepID=A0A814XG15_9BILA|nr:unnamed protein product [Didymodactylos carnosus]CAF3977534.1 unnamed protein product [Didymodactylos carnosus]